MSDTGISVSNLLRVFPEVLTRSSKIQALGEVMAAYLTQTAKDTRNCAIYVNIDTLPEAVLDILAYDFKVDWYYASYSAEVKRGIIKNCIKVHKTQGTRAGCTSALNAVFGGSTLEEWMESGGRPYHYAVGIPAVSNVTIDNSVLLSTLNSFVPSRCVLDGDGPAYFSRERIKVTMATRYFVYNTPICGITPYRSTFGEIADDNMAVKTSYASMAYTPKICGTNKIL